MSRVLPRRCRRHSPAGLGAAREACVSARCNCWATAVLLLLEDPDQWPATQRPSITPGAGCELYEAEIPAPTLQTASLAESVMGVWASPHPRRRCPWEGSRVQVQAQVRDLVHSLAAADTFSDSRKCCRGASLLPPRGLFWEHCVSQGPSIPTGFVTYFGPPKMIKKHCLSHLLIP